MKNILLVGLGRVGSRTLTYLRELVRDTYIYAVDINTTKLSSLKGLENVEPHPYEPGVLGRLGERVDVAITALPSNIAFRAILELAGKCVNIVDVSFISEDPYTLERVVEDCKSAFVIDAGFAPGYSNIVIGYAYYKLGLSDDIEVRAGGIPVEPVPPIGYVVTWNPRDLLEEYTRPARYVEDYKVKAIKPVDSIHKLEIRGIGAFEGFVSDGLRTMLKNINARNLREVTIRWPGHMSAVKLLHELGFLDTSEIVVSGVPLKPIDFTAVVLEKKLSIRANDIAILEVLARNQHGRYYRELALLKGTPENPATPVFTALVHAYTAKIVLDKRIKHGIIAPENLYEFKEEYEMYLCRKGVYVEKELSQ